MKLLITGSRSFNNYKLLKETLNQIKGDIELIIHGGAKGADTLAEKYSKEFNIKSKIISPVFKANKNYYLYRNIEMITMCDEVIAFWDGKSTGTGFTVSYALQRNKPVKIIRFDKI